MEDNAMNLGPMGMENLANVTRQVVREMSIINSASNSSSSSSTNPNHYDTVSLNYGHDL